MIKFKVDFARIAKVERMVSSIPNLFVRDEVMMSIFRKASKPLLMAARNNADSMIPNVASDFKWSARKNRGGDIMRVGLVNDKATHSSLGHIFNDGTEDRYTEAGWFTGRIEATHFWDNAVDSSEGAVISRIEQYAPKEIDRFMKKYNL